MSHAASPVPFTRAYVRIVMFEDLNAAGSLFGGRLASWIDEGAAIYCSTHMNARRILTRKISELLFNRPAALGDVLEIWCGVVREGRTSLTVRAAVTRRSFGDDGVVSPMPPSDGCFSDEPREDEICRCDLVFVCVDAHGQPRPWRA